MPRSAQVFAIWPLGRGKVRAPSSAAPSAPRAAGPGRSTSAIESLNVRCRWAVRATSHSRPSRPPSSALTRHPVPGQSRPSPRPSRQARNCAEPDPGQANQPTRRGQPPRAADCRALPCSRDWTIRLGLPHYRRMGQPLTGRPAVLEPGGGYGPTARC